MKQPKLSRWEFERMFVNESGLADEKIQSLGLVPEECSGPCADRHCRGWQMISEKERRQRAVRERANK